MHLLQDKGKRQERGELGNLADRETSFFPRESVKGLKTLCGLATRARTSLFVRGTPQAFSPLRPKRHIDGVRGNNISVYL